MQTKLERGKAAFRIRSVGLSAVILAGAPLIAVAALCAPEQAFAACGVSHPAGVRTSTGSGGTHATTGIAAPSGGGGGVGSLGCANGSSAPALRGLPVASSGRVIETGAHAGRTENHVRTAPTKSTNATAHLHTVKPAHRG
jgi:hypothetical protein